VQPNPWKGGRVVLSLADGFLLSYTRDGASLAVRVQTWQERTVTLTFRRTRRTAAIVGFSRPGLA
jgi:hypothetical protein